MILNARDYEKYFEVDKLRTPAPFADIMFADDGIALRVIRVSQFSGIVRFQMDAQNIPLVRPGSISNTLSNPFRLREHEVYGIATQLEIKQPIPDVVLQFVPDPTFLALGLLPAASYELRCSGPVSVTLFTFRRVEISAGVIIGKLRLLQGVKSGSKSRPSVADVQEAATAEEEPPVKRTDSKSKASSKSGSKK